MIQWEYSTPPLKDLCIDAVLTHVVEFVDELSSSNHSFDPMREPLPIFRSQGYLPAELHEQLIERCTERDILLRDDLLAALLPRRFPKTAAVAMEVGE